MTKELQRFIAQITTTQILLVQSKLIKKNVSKRHINYDAVIKKLIGKEFSCFISDPTHLIFKKMKEITRDNTFF